MNEIDILAEAEFQLELYIVGMEAERDMSIFLLQHENKKKKRERLNANLRHVGHFLPKALEARAALLRLIELKRGES